MALVVGREGEGLPQTVLDATMSARIRQSPGVDSLNLATAGAIALQSVARRMGRF